MSGKPPFPMVFPGFSYGFPMVFLWFSYVFLWFSHNHPLVCHGSPATLAAPRYQRCSQHPLAAAGPSRTEAAHAATAPWNLRTSKTTTDSQSQVAANKAWSWSMMLWIFSWCICIYIYISISIYNRERELVYERQVGENQYLRLRIGFMDILSKLSAFINQRRQLREHNLL